MAKKVAEKAIQIVTLDVTQYGLKETKVKQIENLYLPMIKALNQVEGEYNKIISQKPTKEVSAQARRLRLIIVKMRTSADKEREKAKAESIRSNNAIQGAYNTLEYVILSKESTLKEIEDHFEIVEKQRIEKLQEDRSAELKKFDVEVIPQNLGEMEPDVYKMYLQGTETNYKNVLEAEAKAEKERGEKAKIDKKHSERKAQLIPYWSFVNEKTKDQEFGELKDEEWNKIFGIVKKKDADDKAEKENLRVENVKLKRIADEKVKQDRERTEREAKAKEEKADKYVLTLIKEGFVEKDGRYVKEGIFVDRSRLLEFNNKEFKDRLKEVKGIIAEKAKTKKLEADLEEKNRLENDAKEKKEKEEKEARLAPDKVKIQNFIKAIEEVNFPVVKSKEAIAFMDDAEILLDRLVETLNKKAKKFNG